jgi:hypothetical protein
MRQNVRPGASLFHLPFLVLVLGLVAGEAAWAQCPGGTFYIDLENGQTMPATPPARITLVSLAPSQNPACPGPYAALLRLDLAPQCSEAEIAVEYGDKPTAWTVHIADSPTSDAYGGDAGTTIYNAELWINQQILWVATNRGPGGSDNELAQENLMLNYGALKFVVKNQHISWAPPYNVLETPHTKKLFALPDPSNPAEGSFIYLGLNRVVANDPVRQGCGIVRALVTIE